jgi:hypothetical protein
MYKTTKYTVHGVLAGGMTYQVVDAKTGRPFTSQTFTSRELAQAWAVWAKRAGVLRGRPFVIAEIGCTQIRSELG